MAAICCLALGACKKSEKAAPKEQIKLLSRVTETDANGEPINSVSITYDSKNRMIKKGGRTYNYTGDDLTSIIDGTNVYTFKYVNGVPVSMHFSAPPLEEDYTYTVSEGVVIKRERADNYSHLFTYVDHNCTAMKQLNTNSTFTYTFSADKNPYYNPTCKYLLLISPEDDNHYNKNVFYESYYQHSPFRGSQNSYSVGPDGYPKSSVIKTTSIEDPDAFISRYYTYEYVMRDVVR